MAAWDGPRSSWKVKPTCPSSCSAEEGALASPGRHPADLWPHPKTITDWKNRTGAPAAWILSTLHSSSGIWSLDFPFAFNPSETRCLWSWTHHHVVWLERQSKAGVVPGACFYLSVAAVHLSLDVLGRSTRTTAASLAATFRSLALLLQCQGSSSADSAAFLMKARPDEPEWEIALMIRKTSPLFWVN